MKGALVIAMAIAMMTVLGWGLAERIREQERAHVEACYQKYEDDESSTKTFRIFMCVERIEK